MIKGSAAGGKGSTPSLPLRLNRRDQSLLPPLITPLLHSKKPPYIVTLSTQKKTPNIENLYPQRFSVVFRREGGRRDRFLNTLPLLEVGEGTGFWALLYPQGEGSIKGEGGVENKKDKGFFRMHSQFPKKR